MTESFLFKIIALKCRCDKKKAELLLLIYHHDNNLTSNNKQASLVADVKSICICQ